MFSKKKRVPRDQIKKVISGGQKCYSELFLIKKIKNNLMYNRYTFVVSKKVEKMAFRRNMIKRKMRAMLCKVDKSLPAVRVDALIKKGNDFVFILNPKIVNKKNEEVLSELEKKEAFMVE